MNDQPRKIKVTLEDLLRLKRAEQPAPEFWSQFERGLRTKQLAAIVEPRPWWAPFIRLGARLARYQLPVGAAAILAVTFLTVREYHPVNMAPALEPVAPERAGLAFSRPAAETAVSGAEVANVAAVPGAPLTASSETLAPAKPMAVDQSAPHEVLALGGSAHVIPVNAEPTPSARYLAETLAAVQAVDPSLDQMLGKVIRSVESQPARIEPLAQINLPGETRRSRLLGGSLWLASATLGDSALRTNDQVTRRLTERRLAEPDAISRIDVGGNRLTLKF